MTSPKDSYAEWDAAYVLGALSPAERHLFEQHLGECDDCAASVAELTVMPGLLSRVPLDQIEDLLAEGEQPTGAQQGPSNDSLVTLLDSARSQRRRDRGWTVAITLAAAAVVAFVAILIPTMIGAGPVASSVALKPVVASPLSADVRLVSEPWGTRIESTCRYAKDWSASSGASAPAGSSGSADSWGAGGAEGAVTYALVITDNDGNQTRVASWTAAAGSTVRPTATTSLPRSKIKSVEITEASDGTPLLRAALG